MFSIFRKKNEEEIPALWKMFAGKGDSDAMLEQKAKVLSLVLLDWLKEGTSTLVEQVFKGKEKPDGISGEVFFESILFSLHYIDRIAASILSDTQREFFMDALSVEVQTLLSEGQPDEKSKKMSILLFMTQYDARQKEYSKYKFVAAKEEGLGGTIFWEYEKKICHLLGFDEDIITMMGVHTHICALFKHLQIPELIQTI